MRKMIGTVWRVDLGDHSGYFLQYVTYCNTKRNAITYKYVEIARSGKPMYDGEVQTEDWYYDSFMRVATPLSPKEQTAAKIKYFL